MSASLNGRRALVTGAASGIGAASAIEVAGRAARVACGYVDSTSVVATVERIRASMETRSPSLPTWPRAPGTPSSSPPPSRSSVRLTSGISTPGFSWGSVLEQPVEELDRILRVNVRGTFLGLQACARAMVEKGRGAMVVTSSGLELQGSAFAAAYSEQARGARPSPLRGGGPCRLRRAVNAVCPGVVGTPILGEASMATQPRCSGPMSPRCRLDAWRTRRLAAPARGR